MAAFLTRDVSWPVPPAGGRAVLAQEGTADSFLQRLLTHADSVTNWISAEIVICDSVKVRGGMSRRGEGQGAEQSTTHLMMAADPVPPVGF